MDRRDRRPLRSVGGHRIARNDLLIRLTRRRRRRAQRGVSLPVGEGGDAIGVTCGAYERNNKSKTSIKQTKKTN